MAIHYNDLSVFTGDYSFSITETSINFKDTSFSVSGANLIHVSDFKSDPFVGIGTNISPVTASYNSDTDSVTFINVASTLLTTIHAGGLLSDINSSVSIKPGAVEFIHTVDISSTPSSHTSLRAGYNSVELNVPLILYTYGTNPAINLIGLNAEYEMVDASSLIPVPDGVTIDYNTAGELTLLGGGGIYTGSGTVPSSTEATITDSLTFSGGYVNIQHATVGVQSHDVLSFTETINLGNGNAVRLNLATSPGSGAITLNWSGMQIGGTYTIIIRQGGNLNTLNWGATVRWEGGTQIPVTLVNGAYDLVTMIYDGTYFYASYGLNFA